MSQFVWPEVATARWYQLEVDAGSTTWWEAAVHCAGGTCSVDPGAALAAGPHSWKVRGRNLLGMGAWSAVTNFVVGPPPVPTPIAPTGELFESAPTYEWLEESCATEYDLEVRDAMNNLDAQATNLLASTVCSAGRCSYVEGTPLAGPDTYSLKVLARSATGDGSLSSPGADFTILACTDPLKEDLSVLQPGPVTTTESVTHCGPVTAGAVGTYVIEASGGDLTVHTRDGFSAEDEFHVRGDLAVRTP